MFEYPEVQDDHRGNEKLEQCKELHLRREVGLTCLINQLRDFEHGPMDRQLLELPVNHKPKQKTQGNNQQSEAHQRPAIDGASKENCLTKIGKQETSFAALLYALGVRAHRP